MNGFDPVLILARTSAVLLAALAVVILARKNPALRVAAVRYGMLGAVLLAAGTGWWRERPQPIFSVLPTMPIMVSVAVPEGPVSTAEVVSKEGPAAPVVTKETTVELADALTYVWVAGSLLLVLQLLLGLAAMARFRLRCRLVQSPELQSQVARLAEKAGIAAPHVREGEAVAGPFVSGVRQATVFLPKGWVQDAEPEVVEAVLRHELAHIANGDLQWGLFGRLVRIALWPQPLLWLLGKPLAAAEEEACDRQVVASGVSSATYAAGLLALREGQAARRTPSLAIGAVTSGSRLSRRVEAIMAFSGKGGVRLSKRGSLAVRIGALGLAAVAAFVFARPTVALAAQDDPIKGWIQKSYATKVRVLDSAGKPLKGAKAYLTLNEERPAQEMRVEGSDVSVPVVESSEDSIGHLAVRVPGYALGFVRLWPAAKPVTELRLAAPVAMQGSLSLPSGGSAAGIKVKVFNFVRVLEKPRQIEFLRASLVPDPLLTAVTDATGRFLFKGLPAKTTIAFDVDDERFAQLAYASRIDTGASGTTTAPSARLLPAVVIEGRVTREGNPVPGLTIGAQENHERVSLGGTAAGNAVTGADGRYRMTRLRPSVYNLAVDLKDGLEQEVTAAAHEAVEVRTGERVRGKDFDLTPGTFIEGTVTGPDGKPLSKVYVGVYGPAHPNSSAWVQGTKTDAQGRYQFRVPAGKQRVYVSDGRYEAEERSVTTSEGVTTVDLRVRGPRKPL